MKRVMIVVKERWWSGTYQNRVSKVESCASKTVVASHLIPSHPSGAELV